MRRTLEAQASGCSYGDGSLPAGLMTSSHHPWSGLGSGQRTIGACPVLVEGAGPGEVPEVHVRWAARPSI